MTKTDELLPLSVSPSPSPSPLCLCCFLFLATSVYLFCISVSLCVRAFCFRPLICGSPSCSSTQSRQESLQESLPQVNPLALSLSFPSYADFLLSSPSILSLAAPSLALSRCFLSFLLRLLIVFPSPPLSLSFSLSLLL